MVKMVYVRCEEFGVVPAPCALGVSHDPDDS
jgi:hypothetical protein